MMSSTAGQGGGKNRVSFADQITQPPPQQQQQAPPPSQQQEEQQPFAYNAAPPPQQQQQQQNQPNPAFQQPRGSFQQPPPQQQQQQGGGGFPPPQQQAPGQGHGGSFYQPPPNGGPPGQQRPSFYQPPPPPEDTGCGCDCSTHGCAKPMRIIGYVGLFFSTGLTFAGAALEDWITYELNGGKKTELGMWHSCYGNTCNARSDYNWGYGSNTSVGYMRQGILALRALFLIQLALMFYFTSVLIRFDYGSIRGSYARNRLRASYFSLLFFSLLTTLWPLYLNDALSGNDIEEKEVGIGWIVQIISTVVVALLAPSGWLAIPKAAQSNEPVEDAKGGQVVDTWDEQHIHASKLEKVKQFMGKPVIRDLLVLFSFICYMTALGSPQWSVKQTEKKAGTSNEYVGPWTACEDDPKTVIGEKPSMTCAEPYIKINPDEFSVLATTQTLSMLGALLLIGQVLMAYAATNRIIEEKKCRFFFLWFVFIEAMSIVLIAASWGREFIDLYSLEKKDEDNSDESKHFGVGWSLLWPTLVFQVVAFISGLSWKVDDSDSSNRVNTDRPTTTEEFEPKTRERAIALVSSVCCCAGGQKAIKMPVYFFGVVAFAIQLGAMGTSKWMNVKFVSNGDDYEVDIGPSLACATGNPSGGSEWSLCSTSIMGLLVSEQFDKLNQPLSANKVKQVLQEVFDNGADITTGVNASLALGAASVVSLVLALALFMIRAARVFSYERMSKAVVHSFHLSFSINLIAASTFGYVFNNLVVEKDLSSSSDREISVKFGWIMEWVSTFVLLLLSIAVLVHSRLNDGEDPGASPYGSHFVEEAEVQQKQDDHSRASRVSNVAQTPIKERRDTMSSVMPNPMAANGVEAE